MEEKKKSSTIGVIIIILLSILICCSVTLIVINYRLLASPAEKKTSEVEKEESIYKLKYDSNYDCGTSFEIEIDEKYDIKVTSINCNGIDIFHNTYTLIPGEGVKQLLISKYIPGLFVSGKNVTYTSNDNNELLDNFINYVQMKDESYLK